MLVFVGTEGCKYCRIAKAYLLSKELGKDLLIKGASLDDEYDALPVLQLLDGNGAIVDTIVGFPDRADYDVFIERLYANRVTN